MANKNQSLLFSSTGRQSRSFTGDRPDLVEEPRQSTQLRIDPTARLGDQICCPDFFAQHGFGAEFFVEDFLNIPIPIDMFGSTLNWNR